MSAADPWRFLDWDSAFFGLRIASAGDRPLARHDLLRVLDRCVEHAIDCLYLLIDASDLETARSCAEQQFRVVDVRATYEVAIDRSSCRAGPARTVRAAQESDVPELRAIAARSHTDSRFHADGRFDRARCDELYATWIEKSCCGWADAVFVAEHDGAAAGYLSCHARGSGRGEIGLLGVAERARGRGLGRALVDAAVGWFGERGIERASVVTQGRNVPAQRLYQSAGFRTARVQLWHHRWFPSAIPERT